jgi:uncharacterized protein with FMN-binding domain
MAGERKPDRTKNANVHFIRDVIECQSARFSDGTYTGTGHTAVVVKGGSQENFSIAEQNWGKKAVRVREMNLKLLVAGKVAVFSTAVSSAAMWMRNFIKSLNRV